jgi:hypothetical protein
MNSESCMPFSFFLSMEPNIAQKETQCDQRFIDITGSAITLAPLYCMSLEVKYGERIFLELATTLSQIELLKSNLASLITWTSKTICQTGTNRSSGLAFTMT